MADAQAAFYRYRTCRGILRRYIGGYRTDQAFLALVASHVIAYAL